MEQFKQRNNARIVAYVDCIFTGLQALGLIAIFVFAIWMSSSSNIFDETQFGKTENGRTFYRFSVTMLWVIVAIAAVTVLITVWATAHLLRATKQGAEPIESLRSIKIWKLTAIIFLVLFLLGSFRGWTYVVMGLVHLAVRVTMIYFVSKFNQELEDHVTNEFERNQHKPPGYTTVVTN